ncbi:N-acetylglucosamine-6-phosphate deacetylase [Cryobacterium sp. TMS1-20-1]|uniref:N-acetylglucosamine-6-phosphate deacetylase n=1 Tax=Cryobacterium sp. TMS1-20-1 TaxID=1259223 RepID=UPI00106D3F75|nr:amidohydrolase family protein [Cryobacterium sp. TMS1-20-1]TFC77260.1 N-acetylglucosamine-6-phosphate deacetylase [Cryobacterium sp. TMS1-20-1]
MVNTWTGKNWLTGEAVTVTAERGTISGIVPSAEDTDVWIAPGLIDVQVNGMGGFNLNGVAPSPDNLRGTLLALHREGVTRFCPTIVTGTRDGIIANLRAVAEACAADPLVDYSVIGIHVEGPFISHEDGPRGAHNAAWVRDPDWAEFLGWQAAAGGRIRKVTVAPEKPGAIEFIEKLCANGVVAAIGHSAASVEDIQAAVRAGASMSTHLGNGAHPYIKRHPNYIWAQLAEDRLWAGLIPDGFHLPPTTLKVMVKVKGRKAILTSDASYLAQMPAGRYTTHHSTEVILEPDGLLHVASTPDILAGSAATLRVGVQNIANFGIAGLGEAINMASLHPAELFGLADSGVGTLRVGGPADLITYRWDEAKGLRELVITETVSGGEPVFTR